eukprot:291276-Pleurochrysis_carterae.AAC.1
MNVWQAERVFTRADDGRTTVRRSVRAEMTGDGEGGAGRRCYDGGVLPCGAALKESLVYGVTEEVVLLPPP